MTERRTAMRLMPVGGFRSVAMAAASHTQPVPRSFQASPDVYKFVAGNAQCRLVEVTWKAGQRDKRHLHGPMMGICNLTDCATRVDLPDGKAIGTNRKAGDARVGSKAPSHPVENIGKADCRVVMLELK